jgi:hypothetical protein
MISFSNAVASGSLANLSVLSLSLNHISDAGMVSFSEVIASGSLANLNCTF